MSAAQLFCDADTPTSLCTDGRCGQVDELLGDRKVTIEDLRALRYTTRVINEGMRLYPQVRREPAHLRLPYACCVLACTCACWVLACTYTCCELACTHARRVRACTYAWCELACTLELVWVCMHAPMCLGGDAPLWELARMCSWWVHEVLENVNALAL